MSSRTRAVPRIGRPMKRLLCLLILAVPACNHAADAPPRPLPPISVHFSPNGGCTDAIVKEIHNAQTSILVQAYSFTSTPIAKALVDAHKRGLKIEVILDKSQRTEKYSEADFLHNMGIQVKIDAKHAIAHNKVMVIDEGVVITGSFNFTRAAEENNAENLLVIRARPWPRSTRPTGRPTPNTQSHTPGDLSAKRALRLKRGHKESDRPMSAGAIGRQPQHPRLHVSCVWATRHDGTRALSLYTGPAQPLQASKSPAGCPLAFPTSRSLQGGRTGRPMQAMPLVAVPRPYWVMRGVARLLRPGPRPSVASGPLLRPPWPPGRPAINVAQRLSRRHDTRTPTTSPQGRAIQREP